MRCDNDFPRRRTTMRRASAVLALLVSLTLGMGGAFAQSGESPADPSLDLPALVLRPGDLPAGYGVLDGLFIPQSTDVVGEYWAEVGVPDPATDGASVSRKAITRLAHYEDVDAAQERLNSFRDDLSGVSPEGDEIVIADENGQPLDAPRQLVPDAPIIGEDTVTSTLTTTNSQGSPVNSLEITYRTGPILASVSISDFAGIPPAYDEVAALAYVVLDRLAGAEETPGPGWSVKTLRFNDTDEFRQVESAESYLAVGSESFRAVNDTEESFAARAQTWAEGNVEDVYHSDQTMAVPGSDDPADQLFYIGRIYGFGSAEDAKAFIDTAVNDLVDNPGGYVSVEEERVSGFGGETGGVEYEVDLGDGGTSTGHRIWVQDGRTVVSIQADAAAGIDLDGVKELARMQIDCIKSDEPCAPVAVPAELFG